MYSLRFLFATFLLPVLAIAQIGVNTTSPDTSSILDISSTNKGLLIPRMSASDVQAIKNPRNSLLVYDTTNAKYLYYLKPNWYELNPIKAPVKDDSISIAKKLSLGNPLSPTGQKLTVNGSAVVKEGIVAKQVTTTSISTQNLLTTNITATGTISANEIALPNTGMGLVPKGVIVMWSGTIKSIPTGWALCDGRNGTPDLRGRFVVGYDSTDTDYNNVSKLGPSHTDADGTFTGASTQEAKQIRLTANQSGLQDHRHVTGIKDNDYINGGYVGTPQATRQTNDDNDTWIYSWGIDGGARSAINSHENRPPFYVLAYIIKL